MLYFLKTHVMDINSMEYMDHQKVHRYHWRCHGQMRQKKIGPNVNIFGIAPMRTALRARFFPGENKEKLMSPKAEANRVLATLFDP